jgi:hypothetical protein
MKLTKKITLALGLLTAGTSFAQTTAPVSNGLLGQRYAEFNFSFVEIDSVSDYSYSPGLSANIPLIPSLLDVGASYNYTKVRGPLKGHANSLSTYAVAYVPLEGVKPFVGASLGHEWTSLGGGFSDNAGVWGVSAGVEIPIGSFTLTPRIGYSDDFENGFGEDDVWTYAVEGNYWFSPKSAVFASIAKIDLHRNPIDVWNYEVGFRLKF